MFSWLEYRRRFSQAVEVLDSDDAWPRDKVWNCVAVTAVCVFVIIAAYRIHLPGLYFDEVIFADAAQGDFNTDRVYSRIGPVPILIMPYVGALKAWLYVPIFRMFGVSASSVRLPVIIIAAATLLIWNQVLRKKLGASWAAIVVCILAVDPAVIFPSRVDWGPTVLMHLFQAAILGLWFSYRDNAMAWKPALMAVCCGLGFYDKFNFIWFIVAFCAGILLCYPDSIKSLSYSVPKPLRAVELLLLVAALGTMAYLIAPLVRSPAPGIINPHFIQSWQEFQVTLAGVAMADLIFGSSSGLLTTLPRALIFTSIALMLFSSLFPMSNNDARDNRKNGVFCLVVMLLIFLQIAITPQARGPHHHSMLAPLPLLACAFFLRALYDHFHEINLSPVARRTAWGAAAAASVLFLANIYNTSIYVSHFRNNSHYEPLWSPAIYPLSRYINEHGGQSQRIVCADCCMHDQLHALASKGLRARIQNFWVSFARLPQDAAEQQAMLNRIFPPGRSLMITFEASKELFPQVRKNLLQLLSSDPNLELRLGKDFSYGGEKIYQIYEVVRH